MDRIAPIVDFHTHFLAREVLEQYLLYSVATDRGHHHPPPHLLALFEKMMSPKQKHPYRPGPSYSITLSAWASRVGGISIAKLLAVWRLITSSNLVGCITGKSAGLTPLRI
jgi:hypothetical protein